MLTIRLAAAWDIYISFINFYYSLSSEEKEKIVIKKL